MKPLILLVCVFVFSFLDIGFNKKIYSQEIKYEDIFDFLDELTNEQAYTRLLRYQSQNPQFANTYLQLGNICETMFIETDPLREVELVHYWAERAILYYGLFPIYFDSGELRRNQRFYSNINMAPSGQRLNEKIVLDYVNSRKTFAESYRDSISLIYASLERSKEHYNNCVRTFNNISANYETLNDALLKADEGLLALLENLDKEFNNVINEFDQYKSLLELFPLKGYIRTQEVQLGRYISILETRVGAYNQVYSLRPIKTFRLDGITNSDFLKDTVYLWDYGSWVNDFKDTYNQDILSLRNEIEQIQIRFNNNQASLARMNIAPPDIKFDSFDEFFLFRLSKYDNNSLVRELFDYLDVRQEYMLLGKNALNNPLDSASSLLNRKLRYYYRYALLLDNSINSLDELCNAISTQRVNRFTEFFDKYYNGESGLRAFCTQQKEDLDQFFSHGLENLKAYFANERIKKGSYGLAQGSRGVQVPLFIVDPSGSDYARYTYITRDVFYFLDNPAYASGYVKKGANKVPFVARISDDRKIEWIKEVNINSNIPKLAEKIYAYENGVIALITNHLISDHQTGQEITNHIVKFDQAGNLIFNKEMDEKHYPFFLQYDEINQLSLMAFGNKVNENIYSEILICQADSTANVIWQNLLRVKGHLVDIVRAEDKYIAYLNFMEYNYGGNLVKTNNDGRDWALLIAEISLDGRILGVKPIIAENSFYINRVFNISSDEINLIGYSGSPDNTRGNLVYMVLSSDGEEIINRSFKAVDEVYKEVVPSQAIQTITRKEEATEDETDDDYIHEFLLIDESPEFIGGDEVFRRYLTENITYPEKAKDEDIQGSVFISFIVEKDGSISNVQLISGIGGGCDEEAIRVIKEMPKWKPGKHNGEFVRVQHRVPVRFIRN